MILFLLIVSLLLWAGLPSAVWAQDEPLQGRVEEAGVAPTSEVAPRTIEPFPQPVLPSRAGKSGDLGKAQQNVYEGSASDSALSHGAEESRSALEVMQGKDEPQTGYLKGYATADGANLSASSDPDAADQELMIEWDRWRNRLLQAIQSGMQERLNNSGDLHLRWDPQRQAMIAKFPIGTVAWFSCQITPDRHVTNVKLLRSSGFPGYDDAVIGSIKDLDGLSILRYPRGSKRQMVTQVAGIKTSDTPGYRYYHFGDVERHIIPGN